MVKKILGICFFAGALLVLAVALISGALFSDKGSAAATYGSFLGAVLPAVVYVLSGIFMLNFDAPTKINYIDGFKKRSKQVPKTMIFFLAYVAFFLLTVVGLVVSAAENYFVNALVAAVLYIVPAIVFMSMFQIYGLPLNITKKYFLNSEAALQEYLSVNETFYTYSADNFVLASAKALYLPQLFCLVPFDRIQSVKLYRQMGEEGIYIYLNNGQKIYLATKQSRQISDAIAANTR